MFKKQGAFSLDPTFHLHNTLKYLASDYFSFSLVEYQNKRGGRAERAGSCPLSVTLFLLAPADDWNQNRFEFRPQLAIWQQEAAAEHNPRSPSVSTP